MKKVFITEAMVSGESYLGNVAYMCYDHLKFGELKQGLLCCSQTEVVVVYPLP